MSRTREEQKARKQASFIQELYKVYGTIDLVAKKVDLSPSVVAPIISEIPNRESFRKRGRHPATSREALIKDLRIGARFAGEPLTIPHYRVVAKQQGLASVNTHIRFFDSWSKALAAAGVKGNEARAIRPNNITEEECISAVAQCYRDFGEWPSYERYIRWAKDRDVPSGPTVRLRIGSWTRAVQRAIDSP